MKAHNDTLQSSVKFLIKYAVFSFLVVVVGLISGLFSALRCERIHSGCENVCVSVHRWFKHHLSLLDIFHFTDDFNWKSRLNFNPEHRLRS